MDEQINKYFQGELDPVERLTLLRQVEADDELKKQFIECKNTHALLSLTPFADDREESRHKYNRFHSLIRKKTVRKVLLKTIGYAAAICLLIVSTYWITASHYAVDPKEIANNTLFVPAGQRIRLTLQDGTNVWLNSQTQLTYPAAFNGKERRVSIEGEAFFEVAPDQSKPFIISSQGVEMKVLGTKFNVYSYPQDKNIQTSLIEGSLQVYFAQSDKQGIILKPDEQVTIRDGSMKVSPISQYDHFLWKEGVYSFDDEKLIDILKKLEIYFDVKIVIRDPSIYQWEYTGKFRQRDGIDQILRMIQRIHKFNIQKDEENNVIILSKS